MNTKSNGYFTLRLRIMGNFMTTKSNGYLTGKLRVIGTLHED
jgi:hypothetical protein